jgi:hypothetical protein
MVNINNFYYNLFNKLHIPRSGKIFHKLLFDDFIFFEGYAKSRNTVKNQIGGSNKIIFKNNKYTFTIYQVKDDDRISFSIYNNNDEDLGDACIVLFIPRKLNYIYLQSISYHDNCAVPGMPKTRGGSLLLDTTLKFINKIKGKYNLTHIQLRDNSFFTCHLDNNKTPISNLYMLTRGDTWYGKYGFIPFNPDKNSIDIDVLVDYKTNQKLVKLIKVKHIKLKQYMKNASYKIKGYSEKLIDTIITKYKDESLQKFFKDFIEKYDTRCDMFNEIYKEVMEEVGIVDLNNKIYYLPLH